MTWHAWATLTVAFYAIRALVWCNPILLSVLFDLWTEKKSQLRFQRQWSSWERFHKNTVFLWEKNRIGYQKSGLCTQFYWISDFKFTTFHFGIGVQLKWRTSFKEMYFIPSMTWSYRSTSLKSQFRFYPLCYRNHLKSNSKAYWND